MDNNWANENWYDVPDHDTPSSQQASTFTFDTDVSLEPIDPGQMVSIHSIDVSPDSDVECSFGDRRTFATSLGSPTDHDRGEHGHHDDVKSNQRSAVMSPVDSGLSQVAVMSVDNDLARAASRSLSMGPSIVTEVRGSSCVLPKNLHPSLYSNSLADIAMAQERSGEICGGAIAGRGKAPPGAGVPGFPDFPDRWQGETSIERMNKGKRHAGKGRGQKWAERQRKRLVRKAANCHGAAKPAAGMGRMLKRQLRAERRARRREEIARRDEGRRRRKGMGDICRGMACMACK